MLNGTRCLAEVPCVWLKKEVTCNVVGKLGGFFFIFVNEYFNEENLFKNQNMHLNSGFKEGRSNVGVSDRSNNHNRYTTECFLNNRDAVASTTTATAVIFFLQ